MKNLIVGFLVGLFITACASSIVIPTLSDRELTICAEGKLCYNYCADYSFFGNCKEWKTDYYDLTKKEVRQSLSDFRCKSRFRNF